MQATVGQRLAHEAEVRPQVHSGILFFNKVFTFLCLKFQGEGFDVMKSGDARVALIGFPSVGKVRSVTICFASDQMESVSGERVSFSRRHL